MKKPLDPRKTSKEPERIHTLTEKLVLHDLALDKVIEFWGLVVKEHKINGHRITAQRWSLTDHYGDSIYVSYTYEWDNVNYGADRLVWDCAIANYEDELAAWKLEQQKRHNKTDDDIDAKITRAEHRLANLIATKAGKPVPFPDG